MLKKVSLVLFLAVVLRGLTVHEDELIIYPTGGFLTRQFGNKAGTPFEWVADGEKAGKLRAVSGCFDTTLNSLKMDFEGWSSPYMGAEQGEFKEVVISADDPLKQIIIRGDTFHVYSLDFVTEGGWRGRIGQEQQGHDFEHIIEVDGKEIFGVYGSLIPYTGGINSIGFYLK